MKTFFALATILACANAGIILNGALPYTQTGQVAGPVHAAFGDLAATKRGLRPVSLEGFSEDDNMDGFVDPIGQAVPYAAPIATPIAAPLAAPLIHQQPLVSTLGYAGAPVLAARPAVTFAQQALVSPLGYAAAAPAIIA
ncbi:hypothetical protein TCAL_16129 [Tigriopus californicus]|uniref:Uncharacterized protein n=1 Tax=Tigriopus californicus TaxID=6832 RepID=A0A553P1L0_TIGCA|nr:uncharacterized protein LOC131883229 [Tigriopus californicus]TRY71566.1 hypothetical protein TCAL_16129 [Tigriopus californicus]